VRHFKKTLRSTIYILTIIAASLLLGFRVFTNPVYITGHLKRNPKDTSAYVEGIAVIVKGDNKILAHTFVDRQGNFEITFTPAKEKSFDFFVFGVAVDTVLIGSVKTFDSDTPEMTFYIPALRKKNFVGQMLCPKCNKADKVYKIVYGDGMPIKMEISESSDTTYSSIVNGRFYAGTCLVGIPKYFCDRDKIKF
jgi:hypothetical protein